MLDKINLEVMPEIESKEFVTITTNGYSKQVHIRTVMESDDIDLKIAVLVALSRERLASDASKSEVIEKLCNKNSDLLDKLRNTERQCDRFQTTFQHHTEKVSKLELELEIEKSKVCELTDEKEKLLEENKRLKTLASMTWFEKLIGGKNV